MTNERARSLRKTANIPEQMIWSRLRARQLAGRKWRRQQPIGPYIVDFFCADLRLVLEIDGDTHYGRETQDAVRQNYLEGQNLRVVRVNNSDVLTNLTGVLEFLYSLSVSDPPSPSRPADALPSPARGEGVGIRTN